ncbi:MAG: DUF2270 domain-containing protein [Candidatus Eisenbacteria bacterium]
MNESEDPGKNFEDYPLTRAEYISALVHLYRAELQRSTDWRLRLDHTTNWAIIATMGLLSFTFGTPDHPHLVLVLGMYMVLTFLGLEARRFRFFDVWRMRVRMIEENFYGPILRRDLESRHGGWGRLVASDLLEPKFKMTYAQAFRARLVRNYIPLFAVLLLSWLLKTVIHPVDIGQGGAWRANLSIGIIPWYVPMLLVAALYGILLYSIFFVEQVRPPESEYWEHIGDAEGVGDLDV